MAQEFTEGPSPFPMCSIKTEKGNLSFPCNSVLIQRVNDLRLCPENKKASKKGSLYLLSTLAKKKYRVSQEITILLEHSSLFKT